MEAGFSGPSWSLTVFTIQWKRQQGNGGSFWMVWTGDRNGRANPDTVSGRREWWNHCGSTLASMALILNR